MMFLPVTNALQLRVNVFPILISRRAMAAAAAASSASSAPTSSTASPDNDMIATTNAAHKRICLTLYRQLLRWCDETDKDIPLAQFIPPIHLKPPQINPKSLEQIALANINNNDANNPQLSTSIATLFPTRALIKETELTVPIANAQDAKDFFRGIFRMNAPGMGDINNNEATAATRKEQVSLAFGAVRSLNELTQHKLKALQESRQKHWDRRGVNFRVGQVVKHTAQNWRGVILGWNRRVDKPSSSSSSSSTTKTSLTQKSYQSIKNPHDDKENSDNDDIMYIVVLDWGDVTLLHQSNRHVSTIMNVSQSDLMRVKDPDLLRIRSGQVSEHFRRFDSNTGSFVPGDVSSYVFPNDAFEGGWSSSHHNPSDPTAQQVIRGIQTMAAYLRQIILGYISGPESRNLRHLSSYLDRLTKLANGDDVVPTEELFQSSKNSIQKQMKWHVQLFVNIAVEIGEVLQTRRTSMETDRTIQFSLGEVVRHRKYGFRGVIVAWDPEPAYEVTHWDGLQHIDNPEQYPFYHVIPDPSDTMAAFGGERPWRYVCEQNLEACAKENSDIDVDLEPEWIYEASSGVYLPPEDLKLRHGGYLEDGGLTVKCLEELKDAIALLFVSIRESRTTENVELDSILDLISKDSLFRILKHAEDSETASVLSDCFKEIWKAHLDKDIRYKFDVGVNCLLKGKTEQALSIFGQVLDDGDAEYAEAWNRASTVEFMIGNLDASMAAAQKTLDLIPDHFQALNGLGLVYHEKRELQDACDSFRKSLKLDPWSPVSGRLSTCLDTLARWNRTSLKVKGVDSDHS